MMTDDADIDHMPDAGGVAPPIGAPSTPCQAKREGGYMRCHRCELGWRHDAPALICAPITFGAMRDVVADIAFEIEGFQQRLVKAAHVVTPSVVEMRKVAILSRVARLIEKCSADPVIIKQLQRK